MRPACGLHVGGDIGGRDEDLLGPVRDLFAILEGTTLSQELHQVLAVEATLVSGLLETFVDVEQALATQDVVLVEAERRRAARCR